MSLSHRVTEILEAVRNITFSAFEMIPVPTTSKSSTNLVTINDTEGGTSIVSANANRVRLIIQNQDSQAVLLSFDEDASVANYSMTLSGTSGVRTGDGGTYATESWKGSINGFTETGSTVLSIFEEVIS